MSEENKIVEKEHQLWKLGDFIKLNKYRLDQKFIKIKKNLNILN